jgi:hypothetical protein
MMTAVHSKDEDEQYGGILDVQPMVPGTDPLFLESQNATGIPSGYLT